jgi:hypothetical protein
MSSSGNTTPNSESFIDFESTESFIPRSLTPNPIKKFKSCLNKISERNFPKISDEMLTIHLLEEPENPISNPSDKDVMLTVVETFMANVCVFERNIEAIQFYTKTFLKLKNNWKGRQGRVLAEVMMSELANFFIDFDNIIQNSTLKEDSEEWILKRNKCIKLCQFVSTLYKEDGVGIKLVLVILNKFKKDKRESIEVFCRLLSGCVEKLMEDVQFKTRFLPVFKEFIEMHQKSETLEPMYRFMCLEILEKC